MRYLLALGFLLGASIAHGGQDSLVVHEWGTFTSHQNADGVALGGANVSTERLPSFVYDQGIVNAGVPRGGAAKTAIASLKEMTMRLETPVLYFYPSAPKLSGVRVEVSFPQGWLTEFYPKAAVSNPGIEQRKMPEDGVGTLVWENLAVEGKGDGPATDSKVWLAPRAVDATSVTTPSGERERYLFYRGVARLDSPVRAIRKDGFLRLEPAAQWRAKLRHQYILADFRADGTCAYRSLPASTPEAVMPLRLTDYSAQNATVVRELLRKQLIDDGLYPKEAEAMLNTWDHAYFREPGLRVFFLTPKAWTDEVLPLAISPSAEVTRVMVGRIELR